MQYEINRYIMKNYDVLMADVKNASIARRNASKERYNNFLEVMASWTAESVERRENLMAQAITERSIAVEKKRGRTTASSSTSPPSPDGVDRVKESTEKRTAAVDYPLVMTEDRLEKIYEYRNYSNHAEQGDIYWVLDETDHYTYAILEGDEVDFYYQAGNQSFVNVPVNMTRAYRYPRVFNQAQSNQQQQQKRVPQAHYSKLMNEGTLGIIKEY